MENFSEFINRNLTPLTEKTNLYPGLLVELFQDNVLTNEEIRLLSEAKSSMIEKAHEFFTQILVNRTEWDLRKTIQALRNSRQDAAADILSEFLQDTVGPITFLEVNEEENRVVIRHEIFERILREVGDRKFAIVSINGEMRRGKSFMMSCFLQFLYSGLSDDWLEQMKNNPTNVFKWRNGTKRETRGISIWSKPFFVRESDGDEVAILLMDCQGAFDKDTTASQNSFLFAVSCLMSSTLIYNVQGPVSENALNPLVTFLQTACQSKSLQNTQTSDLFQNFLLLNRDFADSEYQFGYYNVNSCPEKQQINLFLDIFQPSTASDDAMTVRQHIISCFSSSGVFALPFPGSGIFSDDINKLESKFVEQTTKMMKHLFFPENLIAKQVNGFPINATDYIPFFSSLAQLINANLVPNVQSFYGSVLENQFFNITEQILDSFDAKMESFTSHYVDGMSKSELVEEAHKLFSDASIQYSNFKVFCTFEEKERQWWLVSQSLLRRLKRFEDANDLKLKAKQERESAHKRMTICIAILLGCFVGPLFICILYCLLKNREKSKAMARPTKV